MISRSNMLAKVSISRTFADHRLCCKKVVRTLLSLSAELAENPMMRVIFGGNKLGELKYGIFLVMTHLHKVQCPIKSKTLSAFSFCSYIHTDGVRLTGKSRRRSQAVSDVLKQGSRSPQSIPMTAFPHRNQNGNDRLMFV